MRKQGLTLVAVASLALALFAGACGGDDDSGDNGDPAAQPTATSDAANGGNDGAETDNSGSSSNGEAGSNKAIVTIGDQTYEFDMLACVALGGAIGGGGRATDGSDISVDISLPPEDWETSSDEGWDAPYVRLDDGTQDLDWRAGGDIVEETGFVPEGQSQVDSFSIDGSTGQGTATFIEFFAAQRGDNPEPVSGSFAINCGG